MYKCCIFDLDGTLLNTIKALQKATNLTMERFGLGPLSEEQIQSIVGDGYKMQMERALKLCGDKDLIHYEEALPAYMEIFGKHCMYVPGSAIRWDFTAFAGNQRTPHESGRLFQ